MIKSKHRFPVSLLVIFTIFWVVFAILFKINIRNKETSDFPMVLKRGVIRVCGEEDLFSYYKDQSGLHGFHYELAKAFADKNKLELKYFCEPNLEDRLRILKAGKCDIISGQLPVLTELKQRVLFTVSIMESKLVLVQRKKSRNNGKQPIRDQIELRGKKIGVVENSPYIQRIHNLANEISDSIYIREYIGYSTENLIENVANGVLDYAACDKYVARAYLKKYPGIDVETPLGFSQFEAWAVISEKNRLLDSLNTFISAYKKSPAFTRLIKKYTKD
jgi:membrane-bound lytic murein transglycosylase MltF